MKLMHLVNMLQSGRGYNFFHSDEGGAGWGMREDRVSLFRFDAQ